MHCTFNPQIMQEPETPCVKIRFSFLSSVETDQDIAISVYDNSNRQGALLFLKGPFTANKRYELKTIVWRKQIFPQPFVCIPSNSFPIQVKAELGKVSYSYYEDWKIDATNTAQAIIPLMIEDRILTAIQIQFDGTQLGIMQKHE